MAVTKFYITRQDTDEAYELSATTEVSISRPLIATNRRVESGKSLTDNSYLENATVNFTGIITNIKNTSGSGDTDQFIKEIEGLRSEVPPVLVDVFAENQSVLNCQITTFDISKTSSEGVGGWRVNFTFKEIQFTNRATVVAVPEPLPALKSDVDTQRTQSNSTLQQGDFEVSRTGTSFLVDSVVDYELDEVNSKPSIKSVIGQTTTGG
jgi:hypothetical protein